MFSPDFTLEFPVEPKLAARIERRRIRDEERKRIILDEKKRLIGIDVESLKLQLNERNQKAFKERCYQKEIENEMMLRDQMAVRAHEREVQQRRDLDRAIDRFRLTCQRPETQRDYDLYDPRVLQKCLPPRLDDDDYWCGPSAAQKFAGEDLLKKERERRLKEVQKSWLENQKEEKLAVRKKIKALEVSLDAESLRLAQIAQEQTENERKYRQNLDRANQSFNKRLLHQKVSEARLTKREELETNMQDMGNHIFSDILSEDPQMAISAFGPHRVITDRWKGMTPDQVSKILEKQREQAQEKRIINATEKARETAQDQHILLEGRSELLKERQNQRHIREYHRRLMEENKRLALQQRTDQDFLNQRIYRGITKDEFFDQFGQSCR